MSRGLERFHRLRTGQEESELLTVQEYADRLRLHVKTVYAQIKAGRLGYEVVRPAPRGAIRIVVPRQHSQTQTNADKH